eukprot:m.64585 g.64585  ORF g.64585 m.64585 type:complete len:369 (+) comp9726_c0_seq2:3129-4235(+)
MDIGSIPHTGCRTGTEVWAGAIFGAAMVGMVGILPCLLISTDSELLRGGQLTPTLRTMLGFACGGLLANAFSHLLPEAYRELRQFKKGELRFLGLVPVKPQEPHGFNEFTYVGLWAILGILAFVVLEKLVHAYGDSSGEEDGEATNAGADRRMTETTVPSPVQDAGSGEKQIRCNDASIASTKLKKTSLVTPKASDETVQRRVSLSKIMPMALKVDPAGYLNLIVNSMDNFTHGLAVAGSFCVSNWAGITTTVAIVIHEIPHELGDYAILIRSGFDTRQAIISQLFTSAGGICGAVFGLLCASAEREAIWILPFAAGGFVYIALVSLIPDMYSQETPGFSWWRDVIHVGGGMALVTTTQLIENHYESH